MEGGEKTRLKDPAAWISRQAEETKISIGAQRERERERERA